MHVKAYELRLSLPADSRFAVTAREVAVRAAYQAGCGRDDAETFGRAVEGTVRRCLAQVADGGALPVTVRRTHGPVEVLVDGHTLAVQV